MHPYKKTEPKVKVAARAADQTPIVLLLIVSVVILLLGKTLSGI